MLNSFYGRGTALIALATLAACASTPEPEASAPVDAVVPERSARVDQAPEGPIPGSAADLEQNVGNRVFFEYNEYALGQESIATLRRQAAWMKEYPEARIRLEGHADERGTREYNLALGARRASAAKSYLVDLGIDPSRITTVSYGKERPIDPRSTPEAWARNRNATTVLLTTVGS
ncbi:OmpA family protein [Parvularcula bermudensis HTCC2503]|uniref:Peptidoglycan-associated protein n=1 Tax=Parvularcula bermudensis (strain ATCC BAA-594 / HTCC2503 / KCTC 12087) TaxID=314260 RepID=E0TDI7_PARBH|nr:peptidoglycan-associated lipoprotein Pal [Parvularcula bermudensis]ADM08742.1 OmpA family protein [Parvularcula bermudensis HTCC2503]